MRVGVIRGDLPSPIFIGDLEPTSQINFSTDPPGQTQYLEYPDPLTLTNFINGRTNSGLLTGKGVPAGIQGGSAVTFPLTLTGGSNNVLKVQLVSAGPFSTATIAPGTYANMTALLNAVNSALSGIAATATTDSTGTLFVLQSTAVGVGAYIGVDTNAAGHSTFNVPANLTASQNFTVPTASTIITSLLPPGGPLNVSAANILATVGAAPAALTVANVIAPQFVESEAALASFQVGNLAGYLLPNFNPNPRLVPLPAYGPAISVVANDGTTAFSYGFPVITGAAHNTPNTGDITITGTGLGNSEFYNSTLVKVMNPTTGVNVHVEQKLIAHTVSDGTVGSVSATSIVIPASLLNGLGLAAGNLVEVKFGTLPSCLTGAAASITTAINGVSTVTGLSGMTVASVGTFLKLKGAANPTNNGTFLVLGYVSSSSVTVGIFNGVGGDANNGAIGWISYPVTFTTT